MFYKIWDLELLYYDEKIKWSGYIFVRKNESVEGSVKRHFPSYAGTWFGHDKNCTCETLTLKDVLVSDYPELRTIGKSTNCNL